MRVVADHQTFGSIIKNRRLELDLSQRALAARLGITQPTVARWEADQTIPKPAELGRLARALELDLGEIIVPLEAMDTERQRRGTQVEEFNKRLDKLEADIATILKLLRRNH